MFTDLHRKTHSDHERHIEYIQEQYAEVYGRAIFNTVAGKSTIHTGDMNNICQYILNYKNDLARFGIEAWKEKGQ